MKKVLLILLGLTAIFATATAGSFEKIWDGTGAEITTYRTTQPRYGEARDAYTVMIFVPEDINRTTGIKVENGQQINADERQRVIKLNRVLHFNTGIYRYSVMTSVFTGLEPHGEYAALHPYKISLAASEWCGNFYAHLLPEQTKTQHVMHSYFGTEGDVDEYLNTGRDAVYEDNLPILIRELKGEYLRTGTEKRFPLIPALWESRITHTPLAPVPGRLGKMNGGTFEAAGKTYDTFLWTWQAGNRTVTYRTDAAYPHTILAWESSTGDAGEMIASVYEPYWQLHTNKDEKLRSVLGIQ